MKFLYTIIFLNLFLLSFGQDKKVLTPNKFDYKNLRAADRLMKMKSYYNAIEKYNDFYKQFPNNEEVCIKLGHAYYIARDYKNAYSVYESYMSNIEIKKKQPSTFYFYGQTLKSLGKYSDAAKAFSDYVKQKDKSEEAKHNTAFAKNEVAAYDWIKVKLKEDSSDIHFSRLLGNMNRAYSDFSPHPIHHDTLVYASMESDSIITHHGFENDFNNIKLYEITRQDSNKWSNPIELVEYNTQYAHTANGVLSPDGKYFYFTRCVPDRDNDVVCNIYYVEYDNDKIKQHKPKEVKGINVAGYSSTQPTFQMTTKKGKGGKIDTLITMYFVSNRPKSKGFDIWYSVAGPHGHFKDPKNCGNIINTIGDEVSPYFDIENSKLYFSSNYHFGFGGKDVFVSEGSQSRWTKPKNMLFPTNSSYDDTYYIPVKKKNFKEEAGFIVSNRPGGVALHSETCCDDIYYYKDNLGSKIKLTGDIVTTSTVIQKNAFSDSLSKSYFNQLSSLKDVDTSLTASNFSSKFKRKPKKADLEILKKAEIKKELLKKDTTAFNKYDTTLVKEPVGKTQIGIIKKSVFDELAKNGDTTLASLKEHVKWVDTTDTDSKFQFDIKKGKEYVYVFNNDKNKTKIKKVISNTDTAITVVTEKIISKPDLVSKGTETPQVSFSKKLESVDVDKNKESILVLDNLYFDFDSDIIKEESRPVLQLLLTYLTEKSNVSMEIMGHTDSRGTDEHNLDLSQRRAEAVMNWLFSQGIAEKRLTAKGYGETKPVLPNENPDGSDNPENRAKNRRTEVKIIKSK